jgi:lysine 6-dehydrogenase
MKAAVLGSGLMGSVISCDLSRSPDVDEVVVADLDPDRLKALRQRAGKKLGTEVVNVKKAGELARFLKGFDVVASALPHGAVHPADVVAVKSGAKMVNIAFEDEQMELDAAARKSGATLIPGCGLAPGLGGILLAHGAEMIGGVTSGRILVGGLPQRPLPPFGYKLLFWVVGLLREYMDDARIVRHGKVVTVKPCDEVVPVGFPPPMGTCEAFYSDGLATLLYTQKGFQSLDELTVRYPGHVEKMKLLIDSGLLSKERMVVGGVEVSPFDVTAKVLSEKLSEGDPKDVTVMRVELRGKKGGVDYELLDYYDEAAAVTSMGKTTGYTCSIVTQMLGRGEVEGKGVIPPEMVVRGQRVDSLLSELGARGVRISRKRV